MLSINPWFELTEIIRSLRTIWIVLTPISAVGFCCALLTQKYTLKRNIVRVPNLQPANSEKEGNESVAGRDTSIIQ